jgi:hypothetical protein
MTGCAVPIVVSGQLTLTLKCGIVLMIQKNIVKKKGYEYAVLSAGATPLIRNERR